MAKEKAGILVDEHFGDAILRDAAKHGYSRACPAEKSGQDEFEFEYGEDFAGHIEKFRPTFCKVLVRYNPEGDKTLNQRQADRLRRLAEYLSAAVSVGSCSSCWYLRKRRSSKNWLATRQAYDREMRPRLMVQAIQELQDAGVEAGCLEDRRARQPAGLRGNRGSRPTKRAGQSELHHSGPRRKRSEGAPSG